MSLHEISRHQRDHLIMAIHDRIDNEREPHPAGHLFHAQTTGIFHLPQRNPSGKGRRSVGSSGGGKATHSGLEDLGPPGKTRICVRHNISQAKQEICLHRTAINLQGNSVFSDVYGIQKNKFLFSGSIVLVNRKGGTNILTKFFHNLLFRHYPVSSRGNQKGKSIPGKTAPKKILQKRRE